MTGTEPLWLYGLKLAGKAILSQAIKDAAYHPIKRQFFQRKYSRRLNQLLNKTVDEYESKFPIPNDGKKFPFYHSQAIFEELSKVVLFGESEINLLEAIKENVNIILPTQEQLETFYSIFITKVQTDEKLKSLFINEQYREEIFRISEILTDVQGALARIEGNTETIPEIAKGVDRLKKDVQGIVEQVGFDPTIEFSEYSESQRMQGELAFTTDREILINSILSKKANRKWIHIFGSVLSGKTFVALKLGEHLCSRNEYFSLPPSMSDGFFALLFKHLCARLGASQVSSMEDFKSVLDEMANEELVIIVDDLPDPIINRRETNALVGLFQMLAGKNVHVISIGNEIISDQRANNDQCYTIEIEPFSKSEISECLQKAGCPELEEWTTVINGIAKGNPTIVHTLVIFLQSQSFNPTHDQLRGMVLGEYDGHLTDRVFAHLLRSIVDDQSRELLYRMNIPISPITDETVSFVAGIDPGIPQPKSKLMSLIGLWIKFETDKYHLSPLITHLRFTDLNRPTYLRINHELGYQILKKKKFSQLEAQEAILYFWRAEDFALAGFVLLIVLRDSLQNPSLFFEWGFEAFWYYSKLPNEMPIATRISIRNLQLILTQENAKKQEYLLKDLKNLVKIGENSNLQLGQAYLTLAANSQGDEAQEYILKTVLDEEFFRTIRDEFSEVVPEGIVWAKTSTTKESGSCDEWWELFDGLSPSQKSSLESSELAIVGSIHLASGLYAYEEAKSPESQNWENAHKKLKALEKEAEKRSLPFVALNAMKFQIKILIENLGQLDSGISAFALGLEKYGSSTLNRFLLNDVTGRSLFLAGNAEFAFPYIIEAIGIESSGDEIDDFFIEKIEVFLVGSQLLGGKDLNTALFYSKRAVELSIRSDFLGLLEVAKSLGELAISHAMMEDLGKAIETLETGYIRLFQIPDRSEQWKVLFIRYGHVFNYYSQILQNGSPPEKDANGEEYEQPSRGYFLRPWSSGYPEFYFPQRRYIAVFQLLDYFEWGGDLEKAKLWGSNLERISKEFEFNPYLIMNQNAIPYYLMDSKLIAAVELLMESFDFQERAAKGEDFSHLVDHPQLKETVIGYQSMAKPPHKDDLIIPVIILPHICQILKTSIGNPVQCREKIANFAEWLQDHERVFESQAFVKKLIALCSSFCENENGSSLIAEIDIPEAIPNKFYLQLIAQIFLAELADVKRALEIHFSFVLWIEKNIKVLARGSYAFIVLPYFVAYWKNQYQARRGEFPDPIFWMAKSQPYFEEQSRDDQLRCLFKVLQHHFELNLSRDLDNWINP